MHDKLVQGDKVLSRHNEEADGVELPKEWLNELTLAITSTYGDSISRRGYELKAFGELHKGEVCVTFCLSSTSGCITLMLSIDLDKKQEPKEVLDKTINHSSEFFDLIINNQGEDIFQPNWIKSDVKNAEFFFKITREDISLTIEANRLLRDS